MRNSHLQSKILLAFLLNLFTLTVLSQSTITGKVMNNKNKQPVAFASIVPQGYAQYGTVSDIDGNYTLIIPEKAKIIQIAHVSYHEKSIEAVKVIQNPNIYLEPTVFEINEVLVNAKENPAYRIIRQAAKNKKYHNPDKYKYYACEIYQKTTMGPFLSDTVTLDSTNQRIKNISDSMYVFMMETHSHKYHQFGKGNKEIVEAIRVSGFKKPEFFMSNNEIQPFHFYDEYINLYENIFLSPISNQAIGKYYYEIIDTIISAPDTIFSIFYRPYKNKVFDGLTGQLNINTNGYAIQNIYAKPAGHHLLKINAHQQYQFVNGKWFPDEINYDLVAENIFPGMIMEMSGRSKMMNPIFTEKEKESIRIDNMAFEFSSKAFNRDSTYWNNYRKDSLSFKEKNTYRLVDSISKAQKIELKMMWAFKFAQSEKLPIKFVSIDYNNVFSYNQHEGIQLGMGLYTNDDIAKWFEVGGFFRYGFRDKRFKYGADLTIMPNRMKRFEFGGGYKNDLVEPGYNNFDQMAASLFSRSILMNRADSINDYFVFTQRQFGKWFFRVDGKIQDISPLYDYKFAPDSNLTTFKNNQIGLSIKYGPKERVSFLYGYPFTMVGYPVFKLQYIYGFKDANGNGFGYHKLLFSALHEFKVTGLGKGRAQLKTGYIHNDVPLYALIEGEGSYDASLPFVFQGYFQVVKPGEFFNNRFAALFYTHNFGPILRISDKIKPELVISQNIGWGELYHKDHHMYVDLKSMEEGYFESGLILNNLLLKGFFNTAYLGLGLGAFYKYGPYAEVKQINNFAFKLSLSFKY